MGAPPSLEASRLGGISVKVIPPSWFGRSGGPCPARGCGGHIILIGRLVDRAFDHFGGFTGGLGAAGGEGLACQKGDSPMGGGSPF